MHTGAIYVWPGPWHHLAVQHGSSAAFKQTVSTTKEGEKTTSLTSSDLLPLEPAIFAAICHFVALCAGDRLIALWSSCTGWCLCNLWLKILSTITEETCANQGDYSRSIPSGPHFMDSTDVCNCHMGKSRKSHMYAWRVSYLCFRFPSINIFFPRATTWCLWWEQYKCNKAFREKSFDHVKHVIT